MTTLQDIVKKELGVDSLKPFGRSGGGCICSGQGYRTDKGDEIYIKSTSSAGAAVMFNGEHSSLKAIEMTESVKVPRSLFVVSDPEAGDALVTEYLNIKSLSTSVSALLGNQLARMHKHNEVLMEKANSSSVHEKVEESNFVTQFGFTVPTCCGSIPQDNSWMDSWVDFFSRNKLQVQIDLIEKNYGDRQAIELWSQLQIIIPKFFRGMTIKPALVHGDMWSGNVGQTSGTPVLFDPSSFYGHSEYEFGIATIFSSSAFNKTFYEAYHKVIGKESGFETRQKLYQLFHYLNHWNHFGSGYRGSCISIMTGLLT